MFYLINYYIGWSFFLRKTPESLRLRRCKAGFFLSDVRKENFFHTLHSVSKCLSYCKDLIYFA